MAPLEKLLRNSDNTKLISQYYSELLADANTRFAAAQTALDIQFTDDWTEFVDAYKSLVKASKDRVIQIKIFHRSSHPLSYVSDGTLHAVVFSWL